MNFVKTTPFGVVLKTVELIPMKLMGTLAMLCIHMQENALPMKNIKTKVKPAQKTLVENM